MSKDKNYEECISIIEEIANNECEIENLCNDLALIEGNLNDDLKEDVQSHLDKILLIDYRAELGI